MKKIIVGVLEKVSTRTGKSVITVTLLESKKSKLKSTPEDQLVVSFTSLNLSKTMMEESSTMTIQDHLEVMSLLLLDLVKLLMDKNIGSVETPGVLTGVKMVTSELKWVKTLLVLNNNVIGVFHMLMSKSIDLYET